MPVTHDITDVRVRVVDTDDGAALLSLAKAAGSGFTSLPADPSAIDARIAQTCEALANDADEGNYWLVAERRSDRRILGCSAIFAKIGQPWPFYSFRRGLLHQACPELDFTTESGILTMVNDLSGATEVGGLLVDPAARGIGLGALLARARYMFIADAPDRFSTRIFAEMRGWQDCDGVSPFWESLGSRFIPMSFADADRYGALHGNRFIADLLPKLPIYEQLLATEARRTIGHPHPQSAPAAAMLGHEGFTHDGLVDVFDAGPCMTCHRDHIRTIRERHVAPAIEATGGRKLMLVSGGTLQSFAATVAAVEPTSAGIAIDVPGRERLGISIGDRIAAAPWGV